MALLVKRLFRSLAKRKCANCGKSIRGKGYKWRGKYFCSKKCKGEYRDRIIRKRRRAGRKKRIILPRDAFQRIYWH